MPGQTVGIIGGTGSGKTSLVNLIPRFYEATGGSVRVFGRDVRELDPEALRTRIGIVPQKAELFRGTVVKKDRSLMNAPFVLPTKELDEKFIKEAKEHGFENLKGHRTVGGMRASMYNAMPIEGVEKLVEFMKKFEMENK